MGTTNNTERRGDWCINSLGNKFWPLSPDPSAVSIFDLAHALSLMCRFGCKVKTFYSVGQHSVLASLWGPPEIALELLLHDCAEPLIGFDPPRPVKDGIAPEFRELETGWLAAIDDALNLGRRLCNMSPEYKVTDNRMLLTEKRDLMPACPDDWSVKVEPFPDRIIPWGPSFAEYAFLKRFAELTEDEYGIEDNVRWHVDRYEAFLGAKSRSSIVAAALQKSDSGDVNELLATQIACTELVNELERVKRLNAQLREHVNIPAVTHPIVEPKTETEPLENTFTCLESPKA